MTSKEDPISNIQSAISELHINCSLQKVEKKEEELPSFMEERNRLFDCLNKDYNLWLQKQPRKEVKVFLPSGKSYIGVTWEITPLDLLYKFEYDFNTKDIIVCKLNDELWDLNRPIERSCHIDYLDFNSKDGKKVFWHSSAHLLGEAAEIIYGAHLCTGPPTDEGFFYEMAITDQTVSQSDFSMIETVAKKCVKEKQPFERLVVTKENLLKLFKYNKYKQYYINTKIPDDTLTTVYRCGKLIDLCGGPHVPNTSYIKTFSITKSSASFFLGDAKNDSLQRIYGISFPTKEQMTEYKAFIKEAQKRDHRLIGKQQELFIFDELSPGSCFFLPHGTIIYNTLVDFLRDEYWKRGYQEVITPNIFNINLWETSGHWHNYASSMFSFNIEKENFALKPMNCPSHCLLFSHRDRSYRELPLRYADFGILHRNEYSGALSGLTRVRRFAQDDAHIFCAHEQVESEIVSIFDFLSQVYGIFGFTFKMVLSTRPDKFLGDVAVWKDAEKQLASALNNFGVSWEYNHGDGAFYGPKIDVTVSDALRRQHQCATIQLDFQLPERFNLQYSSPEASQKRPVIIHRAIYGSLERIFAVLTEHYGGKWPLWLSPRQVMVVPVAEPFYEYAKYVVEKLHKLKFHVDCNLSANTFPKKIRNAQVAQWNYIVVVGEKEAQLNSVNVRRRENQNLQELMPINEFIDMIEKIRSSKK